MESNKIHHLVSILSTYLIYKVYQDAKLYNEVALNEPYDNA